MEILSEYWQNQSNQFATKPNQRDAIGERAISVLEHRTGTMGELNL